MFDKIKYVNEEKTAITVFFNEKTANEQIKKYGRQATFYKKLDASGVWLFNEPEINKYIELDGIIEPYIDEKEQEIINSKEAKQKSIKSLESQIDIYKAIYALLNNDEQEKEKQKELISQYLAVREGVNG